MNDLERAVAHLYRALTGWVSLSPDARGRRLPRPRDLRLSRGGRVLVLCAEEMILFLRVGAPHEIREGGFAADNAAGGVAFRSPMGPLVLTAKKKGPLAQALDIDGRDRVVTGWSDGAVRRGPLVAPAATHTLVATLPADVQRIAGFPEGDRVVASTSDDIYVIEQGTPRAIHALSGDDVASSFAIGADASSIAIRKRKEVVVVDFEGAVLRTVALDDADVAADVIVTPREIVTATSDALIVIAADGTVTRCARPEHPDAAVEPGRIAASEDGRWVVALFAGTEGSIEIFDREAGTCARVPWHWEAFSDSPVTFAPDGSAFYVCSGNLHLHGLPFDGTLTRDDEREALDNVSKLVADGDLEGASTLLKTLKVRPGLTADLSTARNLVKVAIEQRDAKRRKEDGPAPVVVPAKPPPAADAFDEGDVVVHPKLGEGTVVDSDGTRITVEFSVGNRVVQASFLRRA